MVLQAVLSILVGPVGGTGGTAQEDFHTGSTSLAGAGSTGPTRWSHMADAESSGVPPVPPVPPGKRPREQGRRNCKSRRLLLRPGGGPVIEYFGVEHVEAGRHNVAAAIHFLLALKLAAGFVGYQQAFGL